MACIAPNRIPPFPPCRAFATTTTAEGSSGGGRGPVVRWLLRKRTLQGYALMFILGCYFLLAFIPHTLGTLALVSWLRGGNSLNHTH